MKRRIRIITVAALLISFISVHAQEVLPADSVVVGSEDDLFKDEQIKNMDDLLNQWYVKCEEASSNCILSYYQDDTTAIEHNDSLIMERLKDIVTAVPLAFNAKVKQFVELYSVKRKKSVSALLGLAQYYYPWMQEIFDKYDVPDELVYLTIVESWLNPNAISRAGATGIWQFMYGTGKIYGLEVNTFVDDRRDPVKATDAAARHLKDLYSLFGDWGLAISAYNCGAGNVRKAIQRSGGKSDFWSVCQYLPKETQNYFPAYLGALYMMKYHGDYGIIPANITIPTDVDTVMVDKELHLEQVAHVLNIPLDDVKILNPQYKRSVIPAYQKSYPLKLRLPDLIRFIELKDSVYNYHHDEYFTPVRVYESQFTGKPLASGDSKKIYYTVKSGDNLSKIASKHGLSVYELKKMNKLSSNYIKVKQRLVVGYEYVKPKEVLQVLEEPMVVTDSVNILSSNDAAEEIQVKDVVYYVKKGDNLSAIANRYGISARKLADYNKISNINTLRIGQKLIIPR